ncbi:hypothetical protein B0T22DRAFT_232993 [Podospora appendiculata]|uniref:FHA domain-containing protein n=1 Tax=Podospora appendiculata TaxID=314037 RepID=A0AAE0X6K1_9PEZI|nr:hypothetical protein B0T22DRAFT_232993 [Podospora appendiculata]
MVAQQLAHSTDQEDAMAADHDMVNTAKSGVPDHDNSVSHSAHDEVYVRLSVDDSEADDILFPERFITLDHKNKSIAIGRASKVQSKGFVEAVGNAWFPSPVMSRQHAEIIADMEEKSVQVRDLGSLHGTYINNESNRLERDELRGLKDGDKLRFGVGIWRGSDSFAPTTVKVGIAYNHRDYYSKDDHATTTFQVPDGSEDGSDMEGYSSDDSHSVKENSRPITPPKKAYEPSSDIIDLTQQPCRLPHNDSGRSTAGLRGVGSREVIDLSVDEDDLESLNSGGVIEIEDDDSEHLNNSSPPPCAPSPDDSASRSDDSEDDSEKDSMDDEMDDIPDELQDYMSWDVEYSEEEEDESSGEQDENNPCDDIPLVVDTKSTPEIALPTPHLPLPVEVVSTAAKGTAAVRIEGLLNNYTECTASLAHSTAIPSYPSRSARQASPSDAAMPKSIMRCPSDPNLKTTAELLSVKHGKFDFFVAREDNRNAARNGDRLVPLDEKVIAPISSRATFGDAPRVPSSVHDLCHKEGPFRHQTGAAGEDSKSHYPKLPEQMADALLSLPRTSEASAPEMNLAAPIVNSFGAGPAPIQALATPATSPQVPGPTAPDLQLEPSGLSGDGEAPTGKERKAQEISELNLEEELWAARGNDLEKPLSPQPLPSPPADTVADAILATFDGMEKESLPLPPAESIQESIRSELQHQGITASVAASHGRPIKKLRGGIKELGYLALGGVTASAILLSGMIYTAPTF